MMPTHGHKFIENESSRIRFFDVVLFTLHFVHNVVFYWFKLMIRHKLFFFKQFVGTWNNFIHWLTTCNWFENCNYNNQWPIVNQHRKKNEIIVFEIFNLIAITFMISKPKKRCINHLNTNQNHNNHNCLVENIIWRMYLCTFENMGFFSGLLIHEPTNMSTSKQAWMHEQDRIFFKIFIHVDKILTK
jgi:hypothetical protein